MTWAKLDDQFPIHTKVKPISDRAFRLYIAGLCYCAHQLTNGALDEVEVGIVAAWAKCGTRATAATTELFKAGLWEPMGEGVYVHDYLDWNPSAEKVLEQRAKRQEAGRRGGKQNRKQTVEQTDKQTSEQTVEQKPNPVSRIPLDDEDSSSSQPLLARTWRLLAERKAASERAQNRGPSTEGWFPPVMRGFASKHADAVAQLDLSGFTPESLADYLEPPVRPKVDPLDIAAAAARAREERHDNPCPDCRGNGILDSGEFCPACHPQARPA